MTHHRPDPDHRPGIRVQVAASMLRHGHPPRAIAEATGVPLALVGLIRDHLDDDAHPADTTAAPEPRRRSPRCDGHAPGAGRRPHPPSAELLHVRRRMRLAVAALVGWVCNLGLAAAAELAHLPILGMASLILAPLLVTFLLLQVLPATSGAPARRRPDRGAPPP
jgi:hypothetical protein